jgi:hypothetical protein
MKNILLTMITLFSIKCSSQIVGLEQRNGTRVNGTYYKDLNNVLDNFTGVYTYTQGNTTLTLKLFKGLSTNTNYTEDIIYGEVLYIENGVTKMNTLNNLNINHPDKWKHNIVGNRILKLGSAGCDECTATERRLRLVFIDDIGHTSGKITAQKTIVNNQEAMMINLYYPIVARGANDPVRMGHIPDGDYTLIKQ